MAFSRIRCSFVIYGFIAVYFVLHWLLLRQKTNPSQGKLSQFTRDNHGQANFNLSAFKKDYFHPEKGDVIVYFHIQKTGGTTFNGHLVNMDISPPCDCFVSPPQEGGCRCRTSEGYSWLFSRFTTASSCGVHPPLQELRVCAPKFLGEADGYTGGELHRFMYMTILRDPVKRYLSEWKHVQKVGPWPSDCKEGNTMQSCINQHQQPITLTDFMNCPGNPANNRQVRMLSLDGLHQCQDSINDPLDISLLENAVTVLQNLHFFGITDQQLDTQRLFEWTFGVKFRAGFKEADSSIGGDLLDGNLDTKLIHDIKDKNKLDIELYEFAKQLFNARYNSISVLDNGRI